MLLRTPEQLSDALAEDFAWRKKELSYLKLLTDGAPKSKAIRDHLLRSLVALLYAHWEGYIKLSAERYLQFVHEQKLANKQLSQNFIAISAKTKLNKGSDSNKIIQHLELVDFFINKLNDQSNLPFKNVINTRSNLSSRILKDIITTIGLDYSPFETKETLIDKTLLDSRNTIAHGEFLKIDYEQYCELHSQILSMLEQFKTQIENAAVNKSYRTS